MYTARKKKTRASIVRCRQADEVTTLLVLTLSTLYWTIDTIVGPLSLSPIAETGPKNTREASPAGHGLGRAGRQHPLEPC